MQPAQRWPHLLVYTRHGGDNEYVCLYGGGSVNRPLICRLRERRLLVLLLSVQAFSNGIVAAGKGGSKILLRIQVDPLREARGCSPVESWSE